MGGGDALMTQRSRDGVSRAAGVLSMPVVVVEAIQTIGRCQQVLFRILTRDPTLCLQRCVVIAGRGFSYASRPQTLVRFTRRLALDEGPIWPLLV